MFVNPRLFIDFGNKTKNNQKYCYCCQTFLKTPVFDETIKKFVCFQCVKKGNRQRSLTTEENSQIVQSIFKSVVKCALCQEELLLNNIESHVRSDHAKWMHLLNPIAA